jgi:hypothetical protein
VGGNIEVDGNANACAYGEGGRRDKTRDFKTPEYRIDWTGGKAAVGCEVRCGAAAVEGCAPYTMQSNVGVETVRPSKRCG